MTSRKQSGCLVAAEVVSDRRTREVVFVVRLWSEGHGEINVAAVQQWLDQLLHPGVRGKMKEMFFLTKQRAISGWVNHKSTNNTCV